MSEYLIRYDGDNDVVEAPSMGVAVTTWTAAMKAQDDEFDDEPESGSLISERDAIRFGAADAQAAL